ncbi:hypothetical protein HMPREF0972_00935 [Actinomyces sp. oral taxon 848 str. F0332]|nr:hypothetical protein HMPREF0972_00935 [Actinomyces sp. oral taxon 848 str. F0332]
MNRCAVRRYELNERTSSDGHCRPEKRRDPVTKRNGCTNLARGESFHLGR